MKPLSASPPEVSNLRVAIIGLGRMGQRHAEAVSRLGMFICGAADVNTSALRALQDEYGLDAEFCFSDPYVMLATVKPEALVIATTAPTHASFVQAAANVGVRYVLCEKPMATSLGEAEAMLAACDRTGTQLAINHQMRFMPQYTQVKSMIGSEQLGPLSSILVAGSNFGLAMNAIHYFEMFRYISGETVHDVRAWFEDVQLTNPRGPQFEDRSGRLLVRNSSGATMYIDFSAHAGWGLNVVYICRYGQIIIDEINGFMHVALQQAKYRELPTSRYGMPADISEERIEPTDTVAPTMKVWRALVAGKDYPDGLVGIHALACLVAAHASHENRGIAVRLDDPLVLRERVFNWA